MKKFWIAVLMCGLLYPLRSFAQPKKLPHIVKVLLVTAHPDDDALYAGTVYKITHFLKGKVDLALVTDGQGGYKYSTLAESIYHLKLTNEKIGRQYLPAIRKRELMNGGQIVGIRNYFFLDQPDKRYTQSVKEVFTSHWDTAFVKNRLYHILEKGHYNFVFVMLPTLHTHGAHKGSAIMAMRAVLEMKPENRPVVLAATVVGKDKASAFHFSDLPGYPVTKINPDAPIFTFDRTQSFGYLNRLNYKIIVNWVIAAHKSQGTMQLLMNRGDIEQYRYLAFNNPDEIPETKRLFEEVQKANFPPVTYKDPQTTSPPYHVMKAHH